jgi:hypothetical protein
MSAHLSLSPVPGKRQCDFTEIVAAIERAIRCSLRGFNIRIPIPQLHKQPLQQPINGKCQRSFRLMGLFAKEKSALR